VRPSRETQSFLVKLVCNGCAMSRRLVGVVVKDGKFRVQHAMFTGISGPSGGAALLELSSSHGEVWWSIVSGRTGRRALPMNRGFPPPTHSLWRQRVVVRRTLPCGWSFSRHPIRYLAEKRSGTRRCISATEGLVRSGRHTVTRTAPYFQVLPGELRLGCFLCH